MLNLAAYSWPSRTPTCARPQTVHILPCDTAFIYRRLNIDTIAAIIVQNSPQNNPVTPLSMATSSNVTKRQFSTTAAVAPGSTSSSTSASSTSSKVLYIGVGVGVAVLVLLFLLGIVCFCYRRRHRRRATKLTSISPTKPSIMHPLQTYNPPGYATSAEQSHGLLANAAPVAGAPSAAGSSVVPSGLQQHAQRPPHVADQGSNVPAGMHTGHQQSSYRPPPPVPQSMPAIAVTPPPVQQQARPPKTGEAAVYFDSSVYIGTQRGRRPGQQQQQQSGDAVYPGQG